MKYTVIQVCRPERRPYWFYTFPQYPEGIDELVLVEEEENQPPLMTGQLHDHFRSVHYIRVDRRKSRIPVYMTPMALLYNIAVKKASHDCIYLTHPECLQFGTFEQIPMVYRPGRMDFFQTWKTDPGIIQQIEGVKPRLNELLLGRHVIHPALVGGPVEKCFWPYGWVFSQSDYMRIGGYEETLMEHYGCEDDIFAAMAANDGIECKVNYDGKIIHLWHAPTRESKLPSEYIPQYEINYNQARVIEKNGIKRANIDRPWGDFNCITLDRIYED